MLYGQFRTRAACAACILYLVCVASLWAQSGPYLSPIYLIQPMGLDEFDIPGTDISRSAAGSIVLPVTDM